MKIKMQDPEGFIGEYYFNIYRHPEGGNIAINVEIAHPMFKRNPEGKEVFNFPPETFTLTWEQVCELAAEIIGAALNKPVKFHRNNKARNHSVFFKNGEISPKPGGI